MLHFGQRHFAFCTNIFCILNKYILHFGKIHNLAAAERVKGCWCHKYAGPNLTRGRQIKRSGSLPRSEKQQKLNWEWLGISHIGGPLLFCNRPTRIIIENWSYRERLYAWNFFVLLSNVAATPSNDHRKKFPVFNPPPPPPMWATTLVKEHFHMYADSLDHSLFLLTKAAKYHDPCDRNDHQKI